MKSLLLVILLALTGASALMAEAPAAKPGEADVFHLMDQVADGTTHELAPLALTEEQIQGRTTWLAWCGGNEEFWDWLAGHGYGFLDLLKLCDSRQRATRFRKAGVINQPGMSARPDTGPWGLYLDQVKPTLQSRSFDDPANVPDSDGRALASDGLDPRVYGYPSGIMGLRLFPNPAFFGDEKAKAAWNAQRYYGEPDYYYNPKLQRPYRVGMSCGFCHVGPHPLLPPADPENPAWENLSSIIGAQYLKARSVFGNLAREDNFIAQFLTVQQPGTTDTSLLATDNLNNPTVMNPIFALPARLKLAERNPPELQSASNLTIPRLLNAEPGSTRAVPRILFDGADSIGVHGALIRVYVNIGMCSREWRECHNPIVGGRAQSPFPIPHGDNAPAMWRATDERMGSLLAFFAGSRVTQPMHLTDAKSAGQPPQVAHQQLKRGREVFLEQCAICHSSKQPDGFELRFTGEPSTFPKLRVPDSYRQWDSFTASSSYQDYVAAIKSLAGELDEAEADPFFRDDNYLAIDQRLPVSLIETNATRSFGTNAITQHVWSEFSSDSYKQLPASGDIDLGNPFLLSKQGSPVVFKPPAGGVGWCRPISLVSAWATAPFLHNNSVGFFNADPSVRGRLAAYEDAMAKLLWPDRRSKTESGVGGLRNTAADLSSASATWRNWDHGWIFRTDRECRLEIPAAQIHGLIEGIVGVALLGKIGQMLWSAPWLIVIVGVLMALARRKGSSARNKLRIVVVLSIVLAWSGVEALPIASCLRFVGQAVFVLFGWPSWSLTACCVVGIGLIFYLLGARHLKTLLLVTLVLAVVCLQAGHLAIEWLNGRAGALVFGPLPKGIPVDLLMNLDLCPTDPAKQEALRVAMLKLFEARARTANQGLSESAALAAFETIAGPALLAASKCPDLTLDHGHKFGQSLSDEDKAALIEFVRTL